MLKLVFLFLCILIITILLYFKWNYQFWKRKKFPCLTPTFPFGNVSGPLSGENLARKFQKVYNTVYSKKLQYAGYYIVSTPRVIIVCPKLLENILQTDFRYFTDRGFYVNEKGDPLSANLFAIGGEKWRTVRHQMSNAFTLSKLKAMLSIVTKCGFDLKDAVHLKFVRGEAIDIKDFAMSYTINVIASCGFGIETNCFKENSGFKYFGNKIFHVNFLRSLKFWFAFSYPKVANYFDIRVFDKNTTAFFINVLKETVKHRKQNNVIRQDIINSILELGSDFCDDEIREMVPQVVVFFAAGYETTSNTLAFCLYELSLNSDLQDRLRREITDVLEVSNNRITYDTLMEMKYMDQVINETLRKYPSLPSISRVCVKDYLISNTKNTIPSGTILDVSILGIHHNPDYYPNPNQFDPERFSKKNSETRRSMTYIPFGEGPRKCIGLKLALINLKVALTILLRDYSFTLNEKTIRPVEYDSYSLTLVPKDGIFLNVKMINQGGSIIN